MKKLLFVPLFLALSWLGTCSFGVFRAPTPAEMIKQGHDAIPSVPALPKITVPDFNPVKLPPQPKAPHARTHAPRPVTPPVAYVVPEEPSAPAVQLECIWPLRLIPGCHPQDAGGQP